MDEMTFTKGQVLKSKKYAAYHDLFNVVLEKDKGYTEAELEKLKDDFLARPIVEQVND